MKKVFKVTAIVLTLALLATTVAFAVPAKSNVQGTISPDIKVLKSNQAMTLVDGNGNTVYPVIINGSAYLPIKALGSVLDVDVNWDGVNRSVVIGPSTKPVNPPSQDPPVDISTLPATFVIPDEVQAVPATFVIPDEVLAVMDEVTALADKYAKQLDGAWGDSHAALMASGKQAQYTGFADMRAKLEAIRKESGAYYVYALYPKDVAATDSEPFCITVDGSEDPDDFGTEFYWEYQYEKAWKGEPAPAAFSWNLDDTGKDVVWSAAAPVHDKAGKVVAILAVDYPASGMVNFPEWNRDSDQWNGTEELVEE